MAWGWEAHACLYWGTPEGEATGRGAPKEQLRAIERFWKGLRDLEGVGEWWAFWVRGAAVQSPRVWVCRVCLGNSG